MNVKKSIRRNLCHAVATDGLPAGSSPNSTYHYRTSSVHAPYMHRT